jgi:multidrug efflux pump subunit AcrA (membrane-fusion protein)
MNLPFKFSFSPRILNRWTALATAGAVVVATGLVAYVGTGTVAQESKAPRGPAAVPVTIATVAQQDVPVRLQAIGNVEPF